MEIVKRCDISAFEPWSGAVTLWGIIEKAGKVDELPTALKVAQEVVALLSAWFADHKRPDVRAEFGGDLRYSKITDGRRDYSLID